MDCKPPIYSLYIASEQLDTSETAAGSGLVRHPVPGGVPQEARVHLLGIPKHLRKNVWLETS
jgi:hypothetical protein